MAMHGHGQYFLSVLLANHVFVELRDDLAWRGNFGEELFAGAAPPSLLFEDRLT
jgi:hypothetical protein